MTLQDRHRTRIRAAMERRHLTCRDVARMAGCHERTVQRFVEGETFDLRTLAKVEGALRLGAVCDAPSDSGVGKRVNPLVVTPSGPVVGWKQAAQVLGVSVWTLWAMRRNMGQERRRAWWTGPDACRRWYEAMIAKGGT